MAGSTTEETDSEEKQEHSTLVFVRRRGARPVQAAHSKTITTQSDLVEALSKVRATTWIVSESNSFDRFLSKLGSGRRPKNELLLLGKELQANPGVTHELGALQTLFSQVISPEEVHAPLDEIAYAITSDKAGEFCIAGTVNLKLGCLTLVRGDRRRLVAPLSDFKPSATAEPDFDRFAIVDDCMVLRFGDYESPFDTVLFRCDPEYRRKAVKRRRDQDPSFGASIRRLRKMRRLQQDQFPALSKKTVGRIERNEHKPTKKTLRVLSEVLAVSIDELGTF